MTARVVVALILWAAACGGRHRAPPSGSTVASPPVPSPARASPASRSVLVGCETMDIGPFQEAFVRRYQCGPQIASGMLGPGPQSHAGHVQMLVEQASKHGYEVQADGGRAQIGGAELPVGFIFHRRPGEESLAFTMLVVTTEVGDDALLIECTVPPPDTQADAEAGVDLCTRFATEMLDLARNQTFREL